MKIFFFGCMGQPGHFLHDTNGRWPNIKLPWNQIDVALTPKNSNVAELDRERRQPQGHTKIHHKGGWTAMAWWDRSGPDTRYGCNSVLFMEGKHDFEQMKNLLKEHWPEVHERQPVKLFLSR